MSDQFEKRVNEPTLPEAKVRAKPVRSDLSKAASEAVKTQQELEKEVARFDTLRRKLIESDAKVQKLKVAAEGAEFRWQALRKVATKPLEAVNEPEEPPMPEEEEGPPTYEEADES